MAPPTGFEPVANRLTADCSTAELQGNGSYPVGRRQGSALAGSYTLGYRGMLVTLQGYCKGNTLYITKSLTQCQVFIREILL